MVMREDASGRRYVTYKQRTAERRRSRIEVNARGDEIDRERNRGFTQLFAAFWSMLGRHRPATMTALAALTASVLFGLLPLYATKIVFDSVLGDEPVGAGFDRMLPAADQPMLLLLAIVGFALMLTIASVSFGLWGRWQATRIAKRVQVEARRKLFEHASRLPLHRVYELKSGGISSLLRDDAGAIGELVFGMIYNPWRAIVQLAGSLIILAFVDWKLLMVGLSVLPVVWFTHRTWVARIRPLWRDIRKTRREIDGTATETFGGMRIVRGFARQRAESTAFMKRNDFMIRQELLGWWWMRGVDTMWAVLIPAASSVLLVYGAWRILGDREAVAAGVLAPAAALTIGDLTAFLMYLGALLGPIATLAATATALQNGLAALDRVLDILAEPREFEETEEQATGTHRALPAPVAIRGEIKLRRVTFRYPKTEIAVIDDVSLVAEAGTTVALVGPSGAGKTTLCNLVARFYDPTGGGVLLDGVDLRDYPVDHFRGLLGIVEQDVFLFDGTVGANIAYGKRDATAEEIQDAARAANAHGFIADLPQGYETKIGERGVKLSGGQRQRLAIARAILADPKVLILDEATSNLDSESERLIQGSLAKLMRGRTSFVIAHRLSTIMHADQIVVMEAGRVVETGTHEQLTQRDGRYAQMVRTQFEQFGAEGSVMSNYDGSGDADNEVSAASSLTGPPTDLSL
ncbi:MAG: ABC transporter ATP-binding protein [Planctomycetota bacterium]